jgi:hypothetical protein
MQGQKVFREKDLMVGSVQRLQDNSTDDVYVDVHDQCIAISISTADA